MKTAGTMKFQAPTIEDLLKNPKLKIEKGPHAMFLQINYDDAIGEPLTEEELKEELNDARRYIGAYRFHKQGLIATKSTLENFIKRIELRERSAAKRYQLLKYGISRLFKDSDSVLDDHEIKEFVYRFEKEKGKTVLKVNYDVSSVLLRDRTKRRQNAKDKMQEIIDSAKEVRD